MLNDLDWTVGTGPLGLEQLNGSEISEDIQEDDADMPPNIEAWRYSRPRQDASSESEEHREDECPEPEMGDDLGQVQEKPSTTEEDRQEDFFETRGGQETTEPQNDEIAGAGHAEQGDGSGDEMPEEEGEREREVRRRFGRRREKKKGGRV